MSQHTWCQRFWPLRRVNWNLGASNLPEVWWRGWKGRGQTCLLPLPSFIHWSAYWACPPRSAAKNGGYYNNQEYWWGHSFNLKAVLENCICSELVNTFDRLCSNKNIQSHPDPFYLPMQIKQLQGGWLLFVRQTAATYAASEALTCQQCAIVVVYLNTAVINHHIYLLC